MPKKRHILIIGGGILGCSAAFALSQRAHCKVTLLEANTLAAATTSSAAALLTRARHKPVISDLVRETFAAMAQLNTLLDQPLPYKKVGSLHIACSSESSDQLDAMAMLAAEQQLPVHDLSMAEVRQKSPWLSLPGGARALFMPEDGFIDPYQLAMAYRQGAAACARQSGAELSILQNTRVEKIAFEPASAHPACVTGVKLADGQLIDADTVIDAAGPWSTLLANEVGVDLAMAPVRSHYWITGKLSSVPPDSPMVILPDARAYARPEVGHLLFGLRDYQPVYTSPEQLPNELSGFCFGHDPEGWQSLEDGYKDLAGFFPEIDRVPVEHYISGISSYTPDGSPLAGFLTDDKGKRIMEGFIALTGCSGGGIGMSGGLGRLAAELALDKPLFTDLKPLALNRFGSVDPLSDDFQRRCALARMAKRSG
ncbi:NAD(P)/FAD-dependent oxidoreductase [Oceanospirillum sp.]|uniref:NAD(P)/FAD-dependent oxidoreductase n=1 Tax=Oceanospirillum sp. TaxID=2021254 RepID=UPI003A91D80C